MTFRVDLFADVRWVQGPRRTAGEHGDPRDNTEVNVEGWIVGLR